MKNKQIKWQIENLLKSNSVTEIFRKVHNVLNELKEYPQENANQIKYYTKLYLELINYKID